MIHLNCLITPIEEEILMRLLCAHELHMISGGNSNYSSCYCPICDGPLDEAATQFSNDYQDYRNRYNQIGFSDGAVLGAGVSAAIGGSLGGNMGSAAGGVIGSYGGRMIEAGFPYGSYIKVKEEAEKIYGLQ